MYIGHICIPTASLILPPICARAHAHTHTHTNTHSITSLYLSFTTNVTMFINFSRNISSVQYLHM